MKHLTEIYEGEPFNFEMVYSGKFLSLIHGFIMIKKVIGKEIYGMKL